MSVKNNIPDGSNPTILVVDDNALFREAITDILELDGIKVLSAADGGSGVKLFKESQVKIDLILLDAKLPDMPGNEVVKRVKVISDQTPIIVASGFPYQHIIDEYKFNPDDLAGHITKPFDAMKLRELVLDAI